MEVSIFIECSELSTIVQISGTPPEIKVNTLVLNKGYSIREAAEAMDVGKSTIDKWAPPSNSYSQSASKSYHLVNSLRYSNLPIELRSTYDANHLRTQGSPPTSSILFLN